jgi:hemerythrin superfamily protein
MATTTTTRERPKAPARTRKTATNGETNAKPKSESTDRRDAARASSTALWGAAAAGVAVGVAAMIGRKVAVQAPTVLAGDWDQALAAEHRAVSKLFDALEATTNHNTGKRTLLIAQMKHALAKHALQEENVVYPALREHGQTDGADQLNHEHGYVKQHLYELENCPKNSDRFLQILSTFRAKIDAHVEEEETTLFPALKAKLDAAANKKLTLAMNKEGFKLA